MKSTPLTTTHRALGARMADFAGFEMPIAYTKLAEEHQAVRERAGMFDVSHMGEFIVRGPQATELLQYVTTNDVAKLGPGQAQYSCLPNEQGGIIDDLLVYRLPQGGKMSGPDPAYMLVVNAGNIQKDWDWIQSHQGKYEAEMVDISDRTALLAVQGPKATELLQTLTDTQLAEIPFYRFVRGRLAGVDNMIISATGYTGSGGFELYFDAGQAEQVWSAILKAGADYGLLPAGLGARDTLRLEKGYCLYGNDIDDTTSPLEAGLGWITKLGKGDFVGRDILLAQKENGLRRRLVGFSLNERRAPRKGYSLLNDKGQPIGQVTSGTHSPSLGYPIGMGYVETAYRKSGTSIQLDFGRKQVPAEVQKIPFL